MQDIQSGSNFKSSKNFFLRTTNGTLPTIKKVLYKKYPFKISCNNQFFLFSYNFNRFRWKQIIVDMLNVMGGSSGKFLSVANLPIWGFSCHWYKILLAWLPACLFKTLCWEMNCYVLLSITISLRFWEEQWPVKVRLTLLCLSRWIHKRKCWQPIYRWKNFGDLSSSCVIYNGYYQFLQ